jgi:hypothetical protein
MGRDNRRSRKRNVETRKSNAKPRDRDIETVIAKYCDEVSEEIRQEEREWGEFSLAQFEGD